MNKYYITNAIPYVNAKPHIGFALEICQSDAIARYHRLQSYDTYFMMGADENSLKNVKAAEKAGIPTAKLVAENTQAFVDLNRALNISNDYFIRTTSQKHIKGVSKLWKACEHDIYKKKYKGLYCVGCEEFKKESDLILEEKKVGEKIGHGCCPEHPTDKIEVVEEKNYFFKLSKYEKELKRIIEKDEYKIVPDSRKNEVLSFINQGLEDFSISRTKERAHGWGIPVPDDPGQVIYVWFDALANYITSIDYGHDGSLFKKFWPADLHVIGKGILKFHAVYWPTMLLSAKIPLPKKLFVHGYLTVGGQKISKSLDNVIDPIEIIQNYGQDALRYYLLKEIPATQDGDFTFKHFEEVYNADLANGLGNLVSRVLTMIEKFSNNKIPNPKEKSGESLIKSFRNQQANIKSIWNSYMKNFDELKFDRILYRVNLLIKKEGDRYINLIKPWELAKKKDSKLYPVLYNLAEVLRQISIFIYPLMPETSKRIREQLGLQIINENKFNFKEEIQWGRLKPNTVIKKKKPLFPRLK